MGELRMPTLGADMTAGRLIEWHVAPGDPVHRGDIVATVDTDKAEIDIESFSDGVVGELVVAPGAKVPVGTVLAVLRDGDGAAPGAPAPPPPAAAPAPPAPAPVAAPARPVHRELVEPPPMPPEAPHRRRVSPLARRIAQERGVDLATVEGSGPGGAVVRADVEAAAAPAPPPPPAPPPAAERRSAEERRRSLAAAVGGLMARSKREIPHYTVQRTIDLQAMVTALGAFNVDRAPADRLLPAAVLLHAVARSALEVPGVNGTYEDGAFHPAPAVDLGVAIALRGGGLIAPALAGAQALSPPELMAALRDLTGRARGGTLLGRDLAPASLTVTNLGDQGADLVDGVIFPPQVALVGFGRIAERPVAHDGLVGARPTVIATLAGDHRVSAGHQGSAFLAALDRHLQEDPIP